jgi:CubicO group peptidase (beta-lactamase class C family)
MKHQLLLLLILTSGVCLSQPATDKRLAGLDTFALKVLKQRHAPGVTIAVVEKGKVVYTGGFGYSNYEKKTPVTENTLFAIGSCTKAFTAAILGMLAKEGKVELDKPVRNFLPELKFKDEYANAHVTLRDMMCHRTGLPRHDISWYGSTASRNELLERIQYLEPSAELREKYQYNNFMFMAQGLVIEKVTGKSWEENMRERILVPLGMTQTNLSVIDMEKAADRSLAYTVKKDSIISAIPYRNIDAIGPAGSVNSCAKDMANWLLTWINDGKFQGKEIIPSSYRNQAITLQMATGGGLPGADNPDIHFGGYGLAWGMNSYRGHYRVEHSGGIDGFITTTCFFPSDSIGIFVSSSQGAVSNIIRNFIADRLLRLSYFNWNKQQLDALAKAKSTPKPPNNDSLNRKQGTKPSHNITDYAGLYENKGYGEVRLFMERDTLWLEHNEAGKRTKSYLQHYHYDVFRLRSTEEEGENFNAQKVRFSTSEKGEVASFEVELEPSVKDIVFGRVPEKLAKNDLQKFTGEYTLEGTIVKVYIQSEKTLMVLVPGQPDYELVPTRENEFDLKIAKGYSVKFEVDGKNIVQSMSFIQPNGTFKATKKK